jgi:signal transduction histidine kinase
VGDVQGTSRDREVWFRHAARRLAGIDPLIADSALAVVLAVPLLIDFANSGEPPPGSPFRGPDPLGFALVGMLVVPLALRRRYPMSTFVVILVAAIVTASAGYHPTSYGFGLIVATYTVARWCGRPGSLVALAAALGFSVFIKIRFIAVGVDIELFEWPLDAAYFAGGWFLGDSIRTRAEQTAELQLNRESLAERAVEREQLRIARELHDSIGHSLSVMVLYAGEAERQLDRAPERSRQLLETAIETGRESLGEMDGLVRVLRRERDGATSVSDIESLANEFEGLGLAVRITGEGTPRSLPDAVDRAAFRLAQEALTNTLKHARARSAEVRLIYAVDTLTIKVADDGVGCSDTSAWAADRHGLVGMRERVLALGGRFWAGTPSGGSGFVVEAVLPVDAGDPP